MPKGLTQKNYDKIVKVIAAKAKGVAKETMSDATDEIKENLLQK